MEIKMVLIIKNDFELVSSNNKIKSLGSMNNNFKLYIASDLIETVENCDIMFVFYDVNKNIMSVKLQECESDKENFKKYNIAEHEDFSLPEGNYSGFISFFSFSKINHISTNSFSFRALPTGECEIQAKLKETILPELDKKIQCVENIMNSYLEKIKKLTELNIKINEDIKKGK